MIVLRKPGDDDGRHYIPDGEESYARSLVAQGWTVVSGMTEETKEVETPEDLTVIPGIGAKRAAQLADAGITTYDGLVEADAKELALWLLVSRDQVRDWQEYAQDVTNGQT